MNNQYVEGLQRCKKAYLMIIESEMIIAMCLYSSIAETRDNVSPVERTKAKEIENGILDVHSTDAFIL